MNKTIGFISLAAMDVSANRASPNSGSAMTNTFRDVSVSSTIESQIRRVGDGPDLIP